MTEVEAGIRAEDTDVPEGAAGMTEEDSGAPEKGAVFPELEVAKESESASCE